MRSMFQELRRAADEVAAAWGEANNFEVDLGHGEVVMFSGWRGRVEFLAVAYGGHVGNCSVAFEPRGDEMLVFAQGAKVVKFDLRPWRGEWSARVGHAARESQARAVCEAIWHNAESKL